MGRSRKRLNTGLRKGKKFYEIDAPVRKNFDIAKFYFFPFLGFFFLVLYLPRQFREIFKRDRREIASVRSPFRLKVGETCLCVCEKQYLKDIYITNISNIESFLGV